MPGFGIYHEVDIDKRHWTFTQQQKGYSCGPTSVKITKEYYHNKTIGEEVIRGSVGLQHSGLSNTGQGLIQAAAASEFRWNNEDQLRTWFCLL